MLLEKFKAGVVPREGQKYILREVETLLKSGYKKIIISAPTGIGKSYVAKAMADALGSSFIVTSTKQLQNQYKHDFPEVRVIKGMSNFECYQLMHKSRVTSKNLAFARGLTCEKGQCVVKSGRKIVSTCEFKEPSNQHEQCVYYKQKDDGLAYNQTVLNYAMYMQLKNFQSDLPGMERDVVIFDEAHTIEDEMVRFSGFDIHGSYMLESGIDQRRYDLESIDGILKLLDTLKHEYADMLERKVNPYTTAEIMRVKRWTRRFDGIANARREINSNRDNFIVQEPQFDNQGMFKLVSVVPLDVSKYASRFFDANIQVFMSATIDHENFARTLGIHNCGFVDVPKSPFPSPHRRIKFLNMAYLSRRSPESDEIKVASMIDSLLATHQKYRGLILTSSKARCYSLLKRLSSAQARRVQMAHSRNEDNSTIDEVLEAHADTSNGVLLSSSLWQGIDLKGDLSRFQIIEKCPYPNLGDARVSAMNRADRRWYVYKTIVKILQGIGRSVRDMDDHAVTYVLDSAVQYILSKNKNMVPHAYHDVIYVNQY